MNILVFEDDGVEQLFPVTTGRPAYAISCGSYRLIDWLKKLNGHLVGSVRSYLEPIQSLDFPELSCHLDRESAWTLVVNARLVPSVSNLHCIESVLAEIPAADLDTRQVYRHGQSISLALLPTEQLVDSQPGECRGRVEQLCAGIEPVGPMTRVVELYQFPHDVIRANLEHFSQNIDFRIQDDSYREVADQVFLAAGVEMHSSVVADTRKGPVVIDRDTRIGPFSFLRGPVYVGPGCRVSEHAAVKDSTAISHTSKIGGEVESCVIESFTNKQHHGFLGHSYLGSWINLGAGTCNSDLKNTYGEVNMQYGDQRVPTGMQFIGCVMGDYAKTAINTSIFTGKVIGTCSMVYGFVTTNVPSFVNYARSFGQVTELPSSVMIATQQRMFARRSVQQRPADIDLLNAMYERTRRERQLSGERLVL
ncbi:MAG: glucose-1-phosphate thymidylyltransferase [Mariniblastus sp.]|nr:glucose-1-phosphate thymidylyltransferase [Mariniblastus sp.]